ncbi:metallo-beta-lactamase superfamily [Pyrenophora seminiperda CCB06]|uniref:Metallo-beta-lactamase superfamily n=1 Tax=Pyrenophora seminiperda CCB06 TaxID=1302712 RepID=A0A3M7M780_9PLEO|nr:metallo-beta-lactamase superfamily [Pyrenophora seminiperda CCB06]
MTETSPKLTWHAIPASDATCKVHLIQAGGIHIPIDLVLLPGPDLPQDPKDSHEENGSRKRFYAPDYVFLIEHTPSGNKYMYDLGIRKDLENLPPFIIKNALPTFLCEPKSPADILRDHGNSDQQPENVKAVIFSHMHFDHLGDGAKAGFGEVELWVGPTSCTYARPGYPVEENAPVLSDTLPVDGSRKVVESYISDHVLREAGDKRAGQVLEGMKKGKYAAVDLRKPDWMGVGAFDRAYDVFGDGSAYIVDAPGHSPGHQMMLLRTTLGSAGSDDTFVLLAGDCYHHPALLKDPRRTARSPYAKAGMHVEPEQAVDTIYRTREFARRDNVWVIGAHDTSIGDGIQPATRELEGLIPINEWQKKNWKNTLQGSF